MKFSELLESSQDRVLELKDVIKFFPNTYAKAIAVKWGDHALMYHGKPFFGKEGIRDVYDEINDVAEYVKETTKVQMIFQAEANDLGFDEFDGEIDVAEAQEVYLGYDKDHDALYVGFDMWLDEESFNREWDEQFETQTGKSFDMDDPEHQEIFDSIWQQYKDQGMAGGLFRLIPSRGSFEAEEEYVMQGGFYRGIYSQSFFKNMDLIDLRLD